MTLQYMAIIKLSIAVLYAVCYALGGMIRKWIRRFLAPLGIYLPGLVFLSLLNHSFNPWIVLSPFLLCVFLHLGYSDNEGWGWVKRLYIGAGFALSALPIAFVTSNWLLFSIHSALCVGFMYSLGTYNPMNNARDEETMIGFMTVVIPIFMI